VEAKPFILDIDFFHSYKAINPDDVATFHWLVRNSIVVTVPECVQELPTYL
jgi:hypothetical protein